MANRMEKRNLSTVIFVVAMSFLCGLASTASLKEIGPVVQHDSAPLWRLDACLEISCIRSQINPHASRSIAPLYIPLIGGIVNNSEIGDPVVGPVVVDVVNLTVRPMSVINQPRKSVSIVDRPREADDAIAIVIDMTSNITGFGVTAPIHQPYKIASHGIIGQQGARPLCGNPSFLVGGYVHTSENITGMAA